MIVFVHVSQSIGYTAFHGVGDDSEFIISVSCPVNAVESLIVLI